MSKFIQIQWTTGSIDEARRVCRYLVQERLVACSSIIPWTESIYLWNNKLTTTQESKVLLKTVADNWEVVRDMILENTTYEVPEILKTAIDDGNEAYLNWLEETSAVKA